MRGSCESGFAATRTGCPWEAGPNPHADAQAQVGHLLDSRVTAEFYLTQIVSHHSRPAVEGFLREAARRGLSMPGLFGVFYYRSANPRTLAGPERFPAGASAAADRGIQIGRICRGRLREVHSRIGRSGVTHFYVSNLPLGRAATTLQRILDRV